MERKHLIWVRTYSGVLGFPPYEIAEFEIDILCQRFQL